MCHSGCCGTIAASFDLKVERTRAALRKMDVGLRNFIMLSEIFCELMGRNFLRGIRKSYIEPCPLD